jgi:hypothetical protein
MQRACGLPVRVLLSEPERKLSLIPAPSLRGLRLMS